MVGGLAEKKVLLIARRSDFGFGCCLVFLPGASLSGTNVCLLMAKDDGSINEKEVQVHTQRKRRKKFRQKIPRWPSFPSSRRKITCLMQRTDAVFDNLFPPRKLGYRGSIFLLFLDANIFFLSLSFQERYLLVEDIGAFTFSLTAQSRWSKDAKFGRSGLATESQQKKTKQKNVFHHRKTLTAKRKRKTLSDKKTSFEACISGVRSEMEVEQKLILLPFPAKRFAVKLRNLSNHVWPYYSSKEETWPNVPER